MGIYADEPAVNRRAALRGLAIALVAIVLAYATAWVTVGRAGRFQQLKGVFFSLDLPESFERIGQEGSGASLTSLADAPQLERTYATDAQPPQACTTLRGALRKADAEVFTAPDPAPDAACSFSGRSDDFEVRLEIRALAAYLDHTTARDLDVPEFPATRRAFLSVIVTE